MLKRFYRPELVRGAEFEKIFEFPIIKPKTTKIPKYLVPFEKRHKILESEKKKVALHFYTRDSNFEKVIERPEKYINEFKQFCGIISLDTTIYTDAPHINQINVMYENRAIDFFWRQHGVNVISNIRWGDIRSFPYCLLGLKPYFVYAISTHGCIRDKEKKLMLKEGLCKMLKKLCPLLVLVHGPMPKEIFGQYERCFKFLHYDTWIDIVHKHKDVFLSLTGHERQLKFDYI